MLLSAYLGLPTVKGRRGEARVSRELAKLNSENYSVFSDLLITTSGGTSQIDHVVVSQFGIFIVETKNYSGWIHGSETATNWTQSIYRFKSRFPNPVKQNWTHVYALRKLLSEIHGLKFFPIVVFAGRAELKNVHSNVPIVYLDELVPSILRQNEVILSHDDVRQVSRMLIEANITEKQTRRLHGIRMSQRKVRAARLDSDLICPKCNGRLFLRSGKYGEFYGCSNYPRCKHTRAV